MQKNEFIDSNRLNKEREENCFHFKVKKITVSATIIRLTLVNKEQSNNQFGNIIY